MTLTRITSDGITDAAIVNADINASAAIAGTKINPSFGNQNVVTSGNLIVNSGQVTINGSTAAINFTDNEDNPDYRLVNSNGIFKIRDATNTVDRLKVNTDGHVDITGNLDVGAGIDVTGNVDLSSAESNASNTAQFKLSNLSIGQHNNIGSYRFANAGTGSFLFSADAINFFNKDVNKNFLRLSASSVELYHDNVKKAETSSTGFDIPEDFIAGSGSKLTVGASGDLTFFHDSANSYVQNNTGDLILGDTNHQYFRGNTSDKSVSLYFNGTEKAKTTSSGITVTGTVTETSDIAFKSDIEPITNTLDKLQQITGYKYKLDNASIDSMGVIAQDVEKVFPELVHGNEGSKTLQYSGLIGVLVEAVKDLSAKVKALESN